MTLPSPPRWGQGPRGEAMAPAPRDPRSSSRSIPHDRPDPPSRLCHPPAPCRPDCRSPHRQQGPAPLPDQLLPVPRLPARGRPVRPQGVRQHLHPHYEPHHRRTRATGRIPGGRHRRLGGEQRPRRADACLPHPVRGGRPHRLQRQPVWRHLQPAALHLPPPGHRHHLCRPGRPGGIRPRHQAEHPAHLRRDPGQPGADRVPLRGGGRHRPRAPAAAGHRQHPGHALPVPAARMGGERDHAQHHQVPQRPRHLFGRPPGRRWYL